MRRRRSAGSDIHGNAVIGVTNQTPASVVLATGNWWGAATGPTDPIGNPGGTGDKVSTGVNYGQFLNAQPLIACSVAPASGSYTTNVPDIALALSCRNATQYRASEDPGADRRRLFRHGSERALHAVVDARRAPDLCAVPGPAGNTVTVNLSQPINFTPNAPTVTLTAPADGAIITANTTITATASDAIGVTKVDFFVDGVPLATVTTPAYSTPWDISAVPNGTHVIKAVATNALLLTAQDTHTVTVQKTGDTTGPSITSIQLAGVPLNSGDTITSPGQLTFSVDDPSGVQSVVVKLDASTLAGGSLVGTAYSIPLGLGGVGNGPHTLSITAADTLNNPTIVTLTINVNLPGDTTGPAITAVRLSGVPLNSGDTVTNSGPLSFLVSDPSGVQSAQAKLDGTLLVGGSLAAGKFTVQLYLVRCGERAAHPHAPGDGHAWPTSRRRRSTSPSTFRCRARRLSPRPRTASTVSRRQCRCREPRGRSARCSCISMAP